MKSIFSTLFALLMLVGTAVQAQDSRVTVLDAKQVSKLDLTGKWVGKRHQYSWDKSHYIETFDYEFDLKQEGDIVTGTTTIINSNGEYADMKLEGVVVGNKFHFREYEISGAVRPEGKVWCFKSGELYIAKDGDNIKFVGATPSYMEIYNYPCSGGFTDIVKVDNSNNVSNITTFTTTNLNITENISISVFPNPFIDNTTVYYNVTEDAKVKMDVFDISGKLVTNLFEGNQKAGSYNVSFNGKNAGYQSGVFILKLTINGEVYSRQLVQMH
ncbi:MAG: T9SS type A sorting domain-containing protein [Chitinophagales bacterium]|nr:T9SS type A sorting domain-containing protein [Chitinophagales bacterium]